jgi:Ca2+-transporting ATPase
MNSDSAPQTSKAADWHTMASDAALAALGTTVAGGLSAKQAAHRLAEQGHNEIMEQRRRPPWRMLLDQFTDFMILVLIAAAIISGIIGELQDSIAILVIVFLNAIIGFIQEYRAERAVAALRRLSAPTARVRREGLLSNIPARNLVPGDIVLLEAGDMISADLRLVETRSLQLDEAALTGESQPVSKEADQTYDKDTVLGDRHNMAFKGTLTTHGRGIGLVVATGMETELGRIAALLSKGEISKTPLQKRLARFGQRLAIAVLVICAIIFAAGLLRGESPIIMFLTAVSLAVAAIPEALPAVVTVSLAIGARNMVRQQALIRRLPAVETLGSVTYICSDKTGTLTQNKMSVELIYADGRQTAPPAQAPAPDSPDALLLSSFALNNDATLDAEERVSGDPTEIALYAAAQQAGLERHELEQASPRVAELPFDADRKRMTTLHQTTEGIIAFTKGAPERVLALCTEILATEGSEPLDQTLILDEAEQLAAQGYRVLAFACRRWPSLPDSLEPEQIEAGLQFLGLAALMDPPRPEAAEAVALCKTAGITPVMITGDHAATALTIARQLGIADDDIPVMEGTELAELSQEAFEARVETLQVYARVSPEQKIKIVQGLQDKGAFVAMTGDGVNDAPALKHADIGVAMGQKGTDVAREAADMVLLDDNFATIVKAVREGRRIYDNVRKFVKYTMTSNSGELWTLFLAPFVGLPIPLLPIHILWINLVTDGLPGLALAVEPEERGIMQRPPRPPQESIFAHGMWQHMLWIGLLIGGLSILSQALALHNGSSHWQTIVFTVLTLSQLAQALAIRSERDSLFTIGLTSNLPLLGAIILTIALQLAIIYTPFLQSIFKTQALSLTELGLCFIPPLVVFAVVECEKWLARRNLLYQTS